jgi:hypothetical protein
VRDDRSAGAAYHAIHVLADCGPSQSDRDRYDTGFHDHDACPDIHGDDGDDADQDHDPTPGHPDELADQPQPADAPGGDRARGHQAADVAQGGGADLRCRIGGRSGCVGRRDADA